MDTIRRTAKSRAQRPSGAVGARERLDPPQGNGRQGVDFGGNRSDEGGGGAAAETKIVSIGEAVATQPQNELPTTDAERSAGGGGDPQEALAAWCQESSDVNDWPEAAQRWRKFRETYPSNVWGFVKEAIALVNMGLGATGMALLTAAERQFPDDPAVDLGFAEVAMTRRDYDQAATRWRKLRERHPHLPWGFTGEVNLLFQKGRLDEAESVLEEFLTAFPDDESGLVRYAESAQKREQWPEAWSRWRKVTSTHPENLWGHVGEAEALISMERMDEARAAMDILSAKFPKAAPPHLARLENRIIAVERAEQDMARFTGLAQGQIQPAQDLRAKDGIGALAEAQRPRSQPGVTVRKPRIGQSIELSVIMPTYNRGDIMENSIIAFLRCAEKMKAELIVVDDGSRDDTPERLKRLAAQAPNLLVERVANGGPARARNLAANMSRGELLVFVGDDVSPVDDDFLLVHAAAHRRFKDRGQAVLGKISWPNAAQLPVNFVMSHVQGDGQQQFGYMHMKPYQWYGWQVFYSSNISVKKKIVSDWSIDGYSANFPLAAFEDAEFALRMTKRLQKTDEPFGVFYTPTAHLVHHHPYTVESFLKRQVATGMMAPRFLEVHPDYVDALGLGGLVERLNRPNVGNFPIEHYLSIFEGLKSWAIVIEEHYGMGSQNWHGDLLRAIFQLAFFEGYIRVQNDPQLNIADGCRYVLETLRRMLNRAISTEILGDLTGFGFV